MTRRLNDSRGGRYEVTDSTDSESQVWERQKRLPRRQGGHYDGAHYDGAHYDGAHYDGAHYDGAHYDGAHYDETKEHGFYDTSKSGRLKTAGTSRDISILRPNTVIPRFDGKTKQRRAGIATQNAPTRLKEESTPQNNHINGRRRKFFREDDAIVSTSALETNATGAKYSSRHSQRVSKTSSSERFWNRSLRRDSSTSQNEASIDNAHYRRRDKTSASSKNIPHRRTSVHDKLNQQCVRRSTRRSLQKYYSSSSSERSDSDNVVPLRTAHSVSLSNYIISDERLSHKARELALTHFYDALIDRRPIYQVWPSGRILRTCGLRDIRQKWEPSRVVLTEKHDFGKYARIGDSYMGPAYESFYNLELPSPLREDTSLRTKLNFGIHFDADSAVTTFEQNASVKPFLQHLLSLQLGPMDIPFGSVLAPSELLRDITQYAILPESGYWFRFIAVFEPVWNLLILCPLPPLCPGPIDTAARNQLVDPYTLRQTKTKALMDALRRPTRGAAPDEGLLCSSEVRGISRINLETNEEQKMKQTRHLIIDRPLSASVGLDCSRTVSCRSCLRSEEPDAQVVATVVDPLHGDGDTSDYAHRIATILLQNDALWHDAQMVVLAQDVGTSMGNEEVKISLRSPKRERALGERTVGKRSLYFLWDLIASISQVFNSSPAQPLIREPKSSALFSAVEVCIARDSRVTNDEDSLTPQINSIGTNRLVAAGFLIDSRNTAESHKDTGSKHTKHLDALHMDRNRLTRLRDRALESQMRSAAEYGHRLAQQISSKMQPSSNVFNRSNQNAQNIALKPEPVGTQLTYGNVACPYIWIDPSTKNGVSADNASYNVSKDEINQMRWNASGEFLAAPLPRHSTSTCIAFAVIGLQKVFFSAASVLTNFPIGPFEEDKLWVYCLSAPPPNLTRLRKELYLGSPSQVDRRYTSVVARLARVGEWQFESLPDAALARNDFYQRALKFAEYFSRCNLSEMKYSIRSIMPYAPEFFTYVSAGMRAHFRAGDRGFPRMIVSILLTLVKGLTRVIERQDQLDLTSVSFRGRTGLRNHVISLVEKFGLLSLLDKLQYTVIKFPGACTRVYLQFALIFAAKIPEKAFLIKPLFLSFLSKLFSAIPITALNPSLPFQTLYPAPSSSLEWIRNRESLCLFKDKQNLTIFAEVIASAVDNCVTGPALSHGESSSQSEVLCSTTIPALNDTEMDEGYSTEGGQSDAYIDPSVAIDSRWAELPLAERQTVAPHNAQFESTTWNNAEWTKCSSFRTPRRSRRWFLNSKADTLNLRSYFDQNRDMTVTRKIRNLGPVATFACIMAVDGLSSAAEAKDTDLSIEVGLAKNLLSLLLYVDHLSCIGQAIRDGVDSILPWRNLPLIPSPLESALKESQMLDPIVRYYPSLDAYFETNFRLLRYDYFNSIGTAIHNLRRGHFKASKLPEVTALLGTPISVTIPKFRFRPHIRFAVRTVDGLAPSLSNLEGSFEDTLWCVCTHGFDIQKTVWCIVRGVEVTKDRGTCFDLVTTDIYYAEQPDVGAATVDLLMSARTCLLLGVNILAPACIPMIERLQDKLPEEYPFKDVWISPNPKCIPTPGYPWTAFAYQWYRHCGFPLEPSQQIVLDSLSTNPLCVIQGPPGTGKTLIGILYIKALLQYLLYTAVKMAGRWNDETSNESDSNAKRDMFGNFYLLLEDLSSKSATELLPAGEVYGPRILYMTYNNNLLDNTIERLQDFLTNSGFTSRTCRLGRGPINFKNSAARSFFGDISVRRACQRVIESVRQRRLVGLHRKLTYSFGRGPGRELEAQIQRLLRCFSENNLSSVVVSQASFTALKDLILQAPHQSLQRKASLIKVMLAEIPYFIARNKRHRSRINRNCLQKYNVSMQILESDTWHNELSQHPVFREIVKSWAQIGVEFEAQSPFGIMPNEGDDDAMNFFRPFSDIQQIKDDCWDTPLKLGRYDEDVELLRNAPMRPLLGAAPFREADDWRPVESLITPECLWHLSDVERQQLLRRWLDRYTEHLRESLKDLDRNAAEFDQLERAKHLESVGESLISKNLVFCTISGGALYAKAIEKYAPDIVIIEEAAEVVEALVIATLPSSAKQVLRPRIEKNVLGREFGFQNSVMERLFGGDQGRFNSVVQTHTLPIQFRMHEELAQFVRPFYKEYISHGETTGAIEPVPCLRSCFYWVYRPEHEETRDPQTQSYFNRNQAVAIIEAVKTLIHYGVEPKAITVLSAYKAQISVLEKLRDENKALQEVNVETVDTFQGKENHVVLVSLVRSSSPGFLAEEERTIVVLSRGKRAMLLFGSPAVMKQSEPWATVVQLATQKNAIGSALPFLCPIHHNSQLDGDKCTAQCSVKMACGHLCLESCHTGEHPPCRRPTEFECNKCGASSTVACEDVRHGCPKKRPLRLNCRHSGEVICGANKQLPCKVQVHYQCEDCHIVQKVECHQLSRRDYYCTNPCPWLLACGHDCASHCGSVTCTVPYLNCDDCYRVTGAAFSADMKVYLTKQLRLPRKDPNDDAYLDAVMEVETASNMEVANKIVKNRFGFSPEALKRLKMPDIAAMRLFLPPSHVTTPYDIEYEGLYVLKSDFWADEFFETCINFAEAGRSQLLPEMIMLLPYPNDITLEWFLRESRQSTVMHMFQEAGVCMKRCFLEFSSVETLSSEKYRNFFLCRIQPGNLVVSDYQVANESVNLWATNSDYSKIPTIYDPVTRRCALPLRNIKYVLPFMALRARAVSANPAYYGESVVADEMEIALPQTMDAQHSFLHWLKHVCDYLEPTMSVTEVIETVEQELDKSDAPRHLLAPVVVATSLPVLQKTIVLNPSEGLVAQWKAYCDWLSGLYASYGHMWEPDPVLSSTTFPGEFLAPRLEQDWLRGITRWPSVETNCNVKLLFTPLNCDAGSFIFNSLTRGLTAGLADQLTLTTRLGEGIPFFGKQEAGHLLMADSFIHSLGEAIKYMFAQQRQKLKKKPGSEEVVISIAGRTTDSQLLVPASGILLCAVALGDIFVINAKKRFIEDNTARKTTAKSLPPHRYGPPSQHLPLPHRATSVLAPKRCTWRKADGGDEQKHNHFCIYDSRAILPLMGLVFTPKLRDTQTHVAFQSENTIVFHTRIEAPLLSASGQNSRQNETVDDEG